MGKKFNCKSGCDIQGFKIVLIAVQNETGMWESSLLGTLELLREVNCLRVL